MQSPPPTLVVVQENRPPVRRAITSELVLGRDPEADFPIDDGYLSRKHCVVTMRGDQVVVRDLGSYNGSYVNGHKLHAECTLYQGDVLKVGRTRVFVDFGGDQSESLRIYAPQLEAQPGVRQSMNPKAPQLSKMYEGIAAELPSGIGLNRDDTTGVGAGSTGTKHHRVKDFLQDDKTPIPPPSVEDSAIARHSPPEKNRHGDRGEHGYRVIAQMARLLANIKDVNSFLDHTLSMILEVIRAERGIVMLLDQERRSLYAECVKSAVPNVDDQKARRLGISHTIAKKVIRERVSVMIDDAVLDQRFREASSVQELQIRSILCVPLWRGDQVSGLIYLDHLLHAYAFKEADRDLLVAAANIAALGLRRLEK